MLSVFIHLKNNLNPFSFILIEYSSFTHIYSSKYIITLRVQRTEEAERVPIGLGCFSAFLDNIDVQQLVETSLYCSRDNPES